MSAETDGHSATNRALTLSHHDGATMYFGQNCCLQGHSFCWRHRKLINLFLFLFNPRLCKTLFSESRNPGILHFYNGKQRPVAFQTNTRFELKHSCEPCHLVLQGQDRKPVEPASPGAPSSVQEPTSMRHSADLHNASLPTQPCVQPVNICWDSYTVKITRTVPCSCILEYRQFPMAVQRLCFNFSQQRPQTLQSYILEKQV